MASEGLSKTVDFKDEILERTWMYSQRVFESPSEAKATLRVDHTSGAIEY
jgi:hypothetical protein